VWECDLLDVQSLAKHNDDHRYLLIVIEVLSKFLHIVQLKTKTGNVVMDAFDTILDPSNDDPSGFEPTKGKNFLMRRFKMYLKGRAYRLRSAEILI